MVMHNFECRKHGHVHEAMTDNPREPRRCPVCRSWADRVYLSPRAARRALSFQPTLYYQKPSGEVVFPGFNDPKHLGTIRDDMLAQGYVEKTIATYRQYEQFIGEERSRRRGMKEAERASERADAEAILASIRSEMNTGFTHFIRDPEDPEKVTGQMQIRYADLSPEARAYYDERMADAERQLRETYDTPIDPREYDAFIDAYERDGRTYEDERDGYRKKSW